MAVVNSDTVYLQGMQSYRVETIVYIDYIVSSTNLLTFPTNSLALGIPKNLIFFERAGSS